MSPTQQKRASWACSFVGFYRRVDPWDPPWPRRGAWAARPQKEDAALYPVLRARSRSRGLACSAPQRSQRGPGRHPDKSRGEDTTRCWERTWG